MKKTILYFTTVIALITSCCKDDPKEPEKTEPEKTERTVLVYVAGDNNLTQSGNNYFTYDLKQLMQGTKDLPTTNKLILFVDSYNEKPYFIKVEQGDTLYLKTLDTEMKSSDPETLYMALKYVTDEFPAESYGLVLWGHADGWIIRNGTRASSDSNNTQPQTTLHAPKKAYGVDNTGGRTYMNIPDMAKVLERLPKLKFIFADCCCFMCVESVYELRSCADYIIGSPAEIPAEGAPYHTVVPAMFSQSDDFYRQIVDAYYAQMSGGYKVPLAAVKTNALDSLAQATAITMASFANDIEPDADNCRYPDTDKLIYYFNHTQFDMQDFMLRYASEEQYQEWKRVFDQAVPYSTFSKVWMANHILYTNDSGTAFYDFTPTEEHMGALGMFLPQRDSDASWWSRTYLNNLGVSMSYMNSEIKNMKWYSAAKLSDLGW